MKLVTILVSMMFAGAAFANGHEATKAAAPAPGTEMAAAPAAEAPVKKEHKKKGKKEDKKAEATH